MQEHILECIRHLAAGPFDSVLMDIRMPVMNGLEATRTLRESGYRGLIAAVTANTSANDVEACSAAGMNDYVTTLVKIETIIDVLRRNRIV